MWFDNMTHEEKYYRYLLRTGASSAAIAAARDKARAAINEVFGDAVYEEALNKLKKMVDKSVSV